MTKLKLSIRKFFKEKPANFGLPWVVLSDNTINYVITFLRKFSVSVRGHAKYDVAKLGKAAYRAELLKDSMPHSENLLKYLCQEFGDAPPDSFSREAVEEFLGLGAGILISPEEHLFWGTIIHFFLTELFDMTLNSLADSRKGAPLTTLLHGLKKMKQHKQLETKAKLVIRPAHILANMLDDKDFCVLYQPDLIGLNGSVDGSVPTMAIRKRHVITAVSQDEEHVDYLKHILDLLPLEDIMLLKRDALKYFCGSWLKLNEDLHTSADSCTDSSDNQDSDEDISSLEFDDEDAVSEIRSEVLRALLLAYSPCSALAPVLDRRVASALSHAAPLKVFDAFMFSDVAEPIGPEFPKIKSLLKSAFNKVSRDNNDLQELLSRAIDTNSCSLLWTLAGFGLSVRPYNKEIQYVEEGESLLAHAVMRGRLELIAPLLKMGADGRGLLERLKSKQVRNQHLASFRDAHTMKRLEKELFWHRAKNFIMFISMSGFLRKPHNTNNSPISSHISSSTSSTSSDISRTQRPGAIAHVFGNTKILRTIAVYIPFVEPTWRPHPTACVTTRTQQSPSLLVDQESQTAIMGEIK